MENRISLCALALAVLALIPCLADEGEHAPEAGERLTFRDEERGWVASEAEGAMSR